MGDPWYVDCQHRDEIQCDWEQFADTEDEGKMIAVLHVLVRHPDVYHRVTGNDPSQKVVEYREYIEAFRSKL